MTDKREYILSCFKTFYELTEVQQKQAVSYEMDNVLTAIVEGFETRGDGDFWDRVEEANDEMERLRTPWFLGERIMETCAADIATLARDDATSALYPLNSVYVSRLLLIESEKDV